MTFSNIAELDEYLSRLGPVYLHIQEYRITHSHLHLRIVGDHFRDLKCNIYLSDTTYISGPTEGGPWRVRAHELESKHDRVIEIAEESRQFVARALRVQITEHDEAAQ
jgi:hypothetical protein